MSRILLLTLEYPPYKGGVAAYLRGMMNQLSALGHEIFVVGETGDVDMKVSLTSRMFRPSWLLPVFRLVKIVREYRPDVVMVSHVLPVGMTALLLKILVGTPFACVVHGMDVAVPTGFKRWLVGRVLRSADHVVCNSSYTERVVLTYSSEIDTSVVYPSADILKHTSKPRGGQRVVSVGRLVERKGFDTLISAIPAVRELCADVHLTIVGEGPDRQRLEQLCSELSVSDCVEFVGLLDDDALHDTYARSDVFCMLPREINGDVEGFGIVFLEAALHELPAVAGGSGGVPEAVAHEVSGYICDPTHKDSIVKRLVELLTHESRSIEMGRRAKERVLAEFSWDVTVRPFAKWLEQKDDRPLISLVIPVYNHAQELAACLKSISGQSYENIEVIVVDDGSATPVEVSGDHVRLVRQGNRGAPSARNEGFKLSSGEYVIFCDADVTMRSDMLQTMYEALQRSPDASYAYSSFRFGFKKFRADEFSSARLKSNNYIHTTSLIRRSEFPGFDESLKRFQDWDVWLTMLSEGGVGVAIDDVLFSIKPHEGGISAWLPSFVYRFPFLKSVVRYNEAQNVIRRKHEI